MQKNKPINLCLQVLQKMFRHLLFIRPYHSHVYSLKHKKGNDWDKLWNDIVSSYETYQEEKLK